MNTVSATNTKELEEMIRFAINDLARIENRRLIKINEKKIHLIKKVSLVKCIDRISTQTHHEIQSTKTTSPNYLEIKICILTFARELAKPIKDKGEAIKSYNIESTDKIVQHPHQRIDKILKNLQSIYDDYKNSRWMPSNYLDEIIKMQKKLLLMQFTLNTLYIFSKEHPKVVKQNYQFLLNKIGTAKTKIIINQLVSDLKILDILEKDFKIDYHNRWKQPLRK